MSLPPESRLRRRGFAQSPPAVRDGHLAAHLVRRWRMAQPLNAERTHAFDSLIVVIPSATSTTGTTSMSLHGVNFETNDKTTAGSAASTSDVDADAVQAAHEGVDRETFLGASHLPNVLIDVSAAARN